MLNDDERTLKITINYFYINLLQHLDTIIKYVSVSFILWHIYLTIVRNSVERASLWNVIITLVSGKSLR